jgi:extradiol dioxygenase family protein
MLYKSNTNLAIHVPDLGKAKQFYTGVLGFEAFEETEDRLVLDTGSLALYVVKDEDTMPFIPALAVSDLDEARRHLEKSGGQVVRDWTPTRAIYFKDPFGIVWDVIET